MEDVLAIYERPYDVRYPIVCMDEASRQLLEHIRLPIIGSDGVTRIDSEYIRHGEQKILLATEPLQGWRTVWVNDTRTKVDWAHFMKEKVIDRYPNAVKIILVCDNLNTHNGSSFYEAYPPEEARRLCERLEIHTTPKHGSWLDMAEIELSALQKQCLDGQRFATKDTLEAAVAAWEVRRNAQTKPTNWQFTTDKARTKLRKLYPSV
jgi:hypothetical protein